MGRNNTPWSLYAALLLALAIFAGRVLVPDKNILSWDNFGYYLYLPNYFIYNDPGMDDIDRVDSLRIKYNSSGTLYQVYKGPKGKHIIRYSMGNAYFYSPFFLIGHITAKRTGAEADGFSRPYRSAVMYGSLIYALISIILARKILRLYFTESVTAVSLLTLFLGTNLFHMLANNNGLTHANLFMVYLLIVWLTIKWHERPRLITAAMLGAACGLAAITRPTDIVSVFIPLLWNVYSVRSLNEKIKLVAARWKDVFALALCMGLVGLPQMLYWKAFAGEYLYRSYDNPGEGLDIFSPHTWPFLFSFRRGWLLYTPMMFFAIAGIILLWFKKREWALAVTVFFVVNLWITSSWTCWWYPGSFGSRAMVQSYGVMLIPLALCIHHILQDKLRFRRGVLVGVLVLLAGFNQFQTWQHNKKILHPERMTREYYFATFGMIRKDPGLDSLLLPERNTDGPMKDPGAHRERMVLIYDFEDSLQVKQSKRRMITDTLNHSGNYAFRLDSTETFLDLFKAPYDSMAGGNYAYVRISGWALCMPDDRSLLSAVRSMEYKGKLYSYRAKVLDIPPTGEWTYFEQDYMTPELRTKKDVFVSYFWLQGKDPVFIDDIRVGIWVPQ